MMNLKNFCLSLVSACLLCSTCSFANTATSWTGKSVKFYVTNNTAKSMKIAPGWGGGGLMLQLFFPEGDVVAPNSTIYYVIQTQPALEKNVTGTLSTDIYKNGTLLYGCKSHMLISANTNGTLTLDDYMNNGLFVANPTNDTSCIGMPTNFTNGSVHLIINKSS